VMIESKFVDVTNSSGKDVGLNWSSLGGDGFKVGLSNMSSTPAKLTTLGADATETTYKTREVKDASGTVTGRVWDLDPDGNKIVDKQGTKATSNVFTAGTISKDVFGAVHDLFNAPSLNTSTFTASEFNVVLKALNTSGNARLVSNPTLVTLNNVEATVNVGDEYPIPNYTYNQEKGSFEVAGFTFRPLGVVLKVTPQVNAAGFIKMSVEPSVSFVNGVVNFGTANIPIINNKTTKTQVSLKNGHTMGIGGLIEIENKTSGTKVPFLGDIPFLGNAFKSKGRSEKLHNLVIFITAKTLDVNEPKVEDVFDPRTIRAMDLKREDLPGYRSSEPAFPKN
jgi:type IV pilus assembly protein PilQ